jgi:hypothetical protein
MMRVRHLQVVLVVLLALASAQAWAGSFYRLNGMLDVRDGQVVLTTDDCRVFTLKMSQGEAQKYDGKLVQIDGVAKDSVQLAALTVKAVRPFEKRIEIENPQPFKNFQRPAQLSKISEREMVVKNVRWSRLKEKNAAGETDFAWKTVKIRPELVDGAYFIKKPFPPEWLAAHCLMLFTFKKGGMVDEQGNESRGLVLSIEAHQRKDQDYSLKAGMKKTFGIIWVLTTWEDYAAETCHFDTKKLVVYPIRFSQQQTKKLLNEAVKQAVVNRSGEFYHTTRNNCTNNLLVLMSKVGDIKLRFWTIPSMIYNVRATMPTMVPKYLQGKGIIGKEYPAVTRDNFFADPSQHFK